MKQKIRLTMVLVAMFAIIYFVMDVLMGDSFGTSQTANYQNTDNSKNKVDCSWCGGVGSVGYSGQSEAQVKRTGMGLGNKCITCKGTGKIEK